jgi:hypothetical protein
LGGSCCLEEEYASRRDDCGLVFLSDRHARVVFDRGQDTKSRPAQKCLPAYRSQIPEPGVCGAILPVVRHPPSFRKLAGAASVPGRRVGTCKPRKSHRRPRKAKLSANFMASCSATQYSIRPRVLPSRSGPGQTSMAGFSVKMAVHAGGWNPRVRWWRSVAVRRIWLPDLEKPLFVVHILPR